MRKVKRLVRASAVYLGGSSVRYVYPCGHYRTETLKVPAPGGGKQPMSPAMVKKLATYWRQGQGVNVPECPTCAREARRGRRER